MKPLLSATVAIFLAGCAADAPPAQEVRDQFQSGFPDRNQLPPVSPEEIPNIGPHAGGPGPR